MDYSALVMTFITLLTAQITVVELARFRYHMRTIRLILVIELVIQVAVNGLLIYFAGVEQMKSLYFLTVDIPAFITFFIISGRRDLRDLFTVLITLFLSFSISIPCMGVKQLLGHGYWWYDFCRAILYAVAFLFLHLFVRKSYIQVQDEVKKGWGVFSILPTIGCLFLFYKYLIYLLKGDFSLIFADCVMISCVMTVVFLVFFYVLTQLHEKYILQEQKRILDIQNKAQQNQFEQHMEANEKINRRWHDMRHNTQQLIYLLEAGETSIALNYLKEQRGADEIAKEEYCLHPAVNSILCLWVQRAKKAGIHVDINADVPEMLEIEPMELSSLFANAFENAYDGCMRLSDEGKKYIKVDAYYNGKRLAIGFMNPCLEDIPFYEGHPVSSKADGGIGTRSIMYTVKRFRGTAYFKAEKGVFTARFILNI